jgi:ABC-type polysaccharide/polyol phosphate transport system ATPase subunit
VGAPLRCRVRGGHGLRAPGFRGTRPGPELGSRHLSSVTTTSAPATPAVPGARSLLPAVTIQGASKAFKLHHRQYHTLKERALHPFQARSYDLLQAVDNVSVDIAQGEFFGIIGRNGSGKSTLLKCLAGIYDIDAGRMDVRGRLSPFIELGVGFNVDLTARDNVILNAIVLGLTRKEAKARFDSIIAFAELEDFLDMRLKNYSSGMSVRLAFSVAIQVDADVLLIDEVLAVGDANFQQKCFDEFQRLKREGRTILFVTHDMGAIQRFCDRAMLLDKGRVIAIGDPADVAHRYNSLNFGRTVHEVSTERSEEELRGDHRDADIVDAWFEDASGARIASIGHREPCAVGVQVRFNAPLDDPSFGITIRNTAGATVFATTTEWAYGPSGHFAAGEVTTLRVKLENWFTPSSYTVTPSIARAGMGSDTIDLRADLATMVVHGGHFTTGVVDLPHEFVFERE